MMVIAPFTTHYNFCMQQFDYSSQGTNDSNQQGPSQFDHANVQSTRDQFGQYTTDNAGSFGGGYESPNPHQLERKDIYFINGQAVLEPITKAWVSKVSEI